MDASHLLQQLGITMGLPALSFDGQGCARLLFDQTLAVDLEHDAGGDCIHVYSALCDLPPPGSGEAVYRALLEGSLAGVHAPGPAPAIDRQAGEIVLCQQFDLATATLGSTAALLERFLQSLERWRGTLASGAMAAPVPGLPSGASPAADIQATV